VLATESSVAAVSDGATVSTLPVDDSSLSLLHPVTTPPTNRKASEATTKRERKVRDDIPRD
jgi:hypothetical protein